jgi:hypothetical protein
MATQLLQVFEDRAIRIPIDVELRDDLRKPERFMTPSGQVSIAATRDEAGHADHFGRLPWQSTWPSRRFTSHFNTTRGCLKRGAAWRGFDRRRGTASCREMGLARFSGAWQ